ncbi:MAG: glycoside hydrolase [Candidatus Coatesbacteria bacterium]|nr:MAG: glycoside hydrolase [Candidatus Coatesbacteria bacterium]
MGKSYVAWLWHFHQPPYAEPGGAAAGLALPWVRLHASRDYYQMAYLAAAAPPELRLTFNFTPSLLAQFELYAAEGRRDRLMDLSLRDPARLTPAEAEALLAAAFDVNFRNVVKDHPRYFKLYRRYARRESFGAAEITDAVALFNLAWTGEVFRTARVELATGAVVELRPLEAKGGGYTPADVEAIIGAQLEIMRAVVPAYRKLQEEGRLEISTTPFYHPILPLLHDSELAAVDRPGASLPPRFSWPEDASEQVRRAVAYHERTFGAPAEGMWPAEGAVSEGVVPYFEEAGMRWIASDEGVLALSGGGREAEPDAAFRPYRLGEGRLAIFFRHHGLSDAVGFEYQHWDEAEAAAADFVARLYDLLAAARSRTVHDVVATVALDGENAWGAYPGQGVAFLTEVYRRLGRGDVARTVTFSEYLAGNPARGVAPHPPVSLDLVRPLACASWIDEAGSAPGNDLGTWIGEPEENRAWELLGAAREAWARSPAPAPRKEEAREYLLAAEASDWFWWYGEDQGGGSDEAFDRLFRENVAAAYRALGEEPPEALAEAIAPRRRVWRPDRHLRLRPGDLLVVEWPHPGEVRFGVNGWQDVAQRPLTPATGAMAGPGGPYRASLLTVTADIRRVEFTFRDAAGEWLGRDFFVLVN